MRNAQTIARQLLEIDTDLDFWAGDEAVLRTLQTKGWHLTDVLDAGRYRIRKPSALRKVSTLDDVEVTVGASPARNKPGYWDIFVYENHDDLATIRNVPDALIEQLAQDVADILELTNYRFEKNGPHETFYVALTSVRNTVDRYNHELKREQERYRA